MHDVSVCVTRTLVLAGWRYAVPHSAGLHATQPGEGSRGMQVTPDASGQAVCVPYTAANYLHAEGVLCTARKAKHDTCFCLDSITTCTSVED